jgi:hypothetical protein
MSLISHSVPNLINGVSQQPPSLRLETQAELQENAMSSVVKGLTKRPSSEYIADLGSIANIDNAFIHDIRRDENEYYTLIITTSDIKVIDKDGTERTVSNNQASYLTGLTNPREELAATTVADYTFILNKNVVTSEATTTSPTRYKEALVYVKQGDYTTNYKIHITKSGTTYTRSIETMGSTQPDDATARTAERSIQTDRIAENLMFSNAVDATYYGGTTPAMTVPGTTFTQYGNVIHVVSTDGVDFQIEVEDSRGNNDIFAFKDTAADFKKLPPSGPDGYVIGVVGSNDKGQDDYYVRLEANTTGGQVWNETLKPGVKTSISASTMPHKLVSNSNGTFNFDVVDYKDRAVGDDETNPFPSFIGLPLSDIFFHRNRLGVLADENVILSEAGKFTEFNFFKRTTLTLLDTDPIDAAVSNNKVSILKHAVPFNESLLLFSDLTQFRMSAQDLLTPETVAIDVTTQFEASLKAKPVGAGRYVFFATNRNEWAGVREYYVETDAAVDDAADITAHVPEYIAGTITKLEASSNEDILLALSSEDPNAIYVYSYYWQGQQKLQSSWSRWTFEGTVLNMTFNKSYIDVLLKYTNTNGSTVTLERINLSTDVATSITTKQHGVHLDRRQIWGVGGVTTLLTDPNPEGGTDLLYISQEGGFLTQTEAQDLVTNGGTVLVGCPFTFKYQLSEQMLKNENSVIKGRLQLRNMTITYSDAGYFEAKVKPTARNEVVNEFTALTLDASTTILDQVSILTGDFRFPVLSQAKEVDITIESDSFLPCSFQSVDWEGYFVTRARQV